MEREIQGQMASHDEANPFDDGRQSEDGAVTDEGQASTLQKAVRYLHEELELGEAIGAASDTPLEIPVFVGHGTVDPKVPVKLGEEANELLRLLEFDVELRLYDGLGHWYSSAMLEDIVRFLQRKTKVKPAAILRKQHSVQEDPRATQS